MIADGDKVGVRVTLRGTSTVLGRAVTIPEIQIYRIANGTIAERWFAGDRSELQQSASATSKGEEPTVAICARPSGYRRRTTQGG